MKTTALYGAFAFAAIAILGCGGGAGESTSDKRETPSTASRAEPPIDSKGRDLTGVDVCRLIPGDAIASALGGTFESATQRKTVPGLEGQGCLFSIKLPQSRTDVVQVHLTPPGNFEMLKTLEDRPVQAFALGDGAYVKQDTPNVATALVLKRGDVTIEVTAQSVDDARKLAEVAFAHLK